MEPDKSLELDPRLWPRAHRQALVVAIVLGVVIAVVIGFQVSGARNFWDWARPRAPYQQVGTMWHGYWAWGGGIPWGALGAACGGVAVYLVKMLR